MIIDGYCTLGVDREYDLTEAALLKAMDKSNVDRAIIAPVDRYLAVNNREGNDFIRKAASARPDRLIPACSANPWYGDAALEEIRRAAEAGARLLVLHPAVQGYLANDELVWPLLDVAVALKIPVYIHTGPPGAASPWQVVDLADRYPALDFIMGHCGATDFWNDVVDAGKAAPNVYLESSLARPFSLVGRLSIAGMHKGIMGSFAPINELTFEWEQMRRVLPPEAVEGVCGGNLLRLLLKRGAL
jgi:predicted TIM-barrel fold metal-dependent hydrolase